MKSSTKPGSPATPSTPMPQKPIVVPQLPPSSCLTLPESTAASLEEALKNSNGKNLHLCDTVIFFKKELALDIPVNLTCENECTFDGGNSRRLFSFGETIWPDSFPVDFNLFFGKIIFQNGRGVPVLAGSGSRQGGGGAFFKCVESKAVALLDLKSVSFAITMGPMHTTAVPWI
jgi:hypothetical protein